MPPMSSPTAKKFEKGDIGKLSVQLQRIFDLIGRDSRVVFRLEEAHLALFPHRVLAFLVDSGGASYPSTGRFGMVFESFCGGSVSTYAAFVFSDTSNRKPSLCMYAALLESEGVFSLDNFTASAEVLGGVKNVYTYLPPSTEFATPDNETCGLVIPILDEVGSVCETQIIAPQIIAAFGSGALANEELQSFADNLEQYKVDTK